MNARILNRETVTPPSDGWYQIEVSGTWPAGSWPDGRIRRQVIDEKALTSILNRFQAEKSAAGEDFAGLLVDLDHLSHDLDKSTEAWAWLKDLEIRNGQLWGKLDLTDLGEAAIRNRRVKWFSTEYDPADLEDLGNGDVRPLRLSGLAFTNRPNNRGAKPITNRNGDEPTNPTNTNKNTMKSIAEALGLPTDADEAAILAKIAEMKSDLESLKTKEAESQADAILNSIGRNIPEAARPYWRGELIKNREDASKAIELSFPAKAEQPDKGGEQRIFNRATATAPTPVEGTADKTGKPNADEAKTAAAIRNRATAIQKSEGVNFATAFARAKAEMA